jgi:hypothetical protein
MKKILTYIIALTVGVVVGMGILLMFNFKKCGLLNGQKTVTHPDTTTVIRYDTVRVYVPQPSSSSLIGDFVIPQVPILLAHNDTIREPYYVGTDLIIPREQKYYSTSQYKAWISGYKPSLDSLSINYTTKTITIENTVEKVARNELYVNGEIGYIAPFPAITVGMNAGYNRDAWGVGIGCGLIYTPHGFKYYGAITIKYKLLTKKW